MQDATFRDMTHLACACPALQRLELLKLTTSSESLFQPLFRLPGLATVRLIDVACMADAAVLASLRHVTGLTSLEISASAASHNRDLNDVLPHMKQLSGLRSLSLSLTSESFCHLLSRDEYYYDGAHLGGLNVLGQFSGLWGLKQLTHLFWGCPSNSGGSNSYSALDEPDPYENFHFSAAAEISVLAICTQLVSLHLASAWVGEEAADLLMAMPRLQTLAVRSFQPERHMILPIGYCRFKSLTLNSCGAPSSRAVTRLSTEEIPDLPLSDLEEVVLSSGQLMMDIEGYYEDDDEDEEVEDEDEVGDRYTLKNRIVSSVRDLAYRLGVGCSKRGESSRFSLVITTTTLREYRYTPNANLLAPWSALAGHLRSLEIHNFPVNNGLIEELAESLPALPELRLHAADITDCGWRRLGLLSATLDVLCIWGGDGAGKASAAPGLPPPSAHPVPTLVQPRHLGLLGSQLTGSLIVAVGPPRFRLAAETGLEVMRALGHAAGGLITLQSLQYRKYRPRSCKGRQRQWREEWAREWRRGGEETGSNTGKGN